MAYHYRQRSREPPAVGQNVDVFTPLPSIHDQARQIQQTGIRPQFGINQRNPAPRQQHQAPARQRARSHVRDVDPVDLIARNLEAPVPKNSHKRSAPMTERILQDHRRRSRSREPHVRTRYEDNVPEKRSRGRPARNQNEPPASSSAKDSRNSRSGVNPGYRIPMTRARSREPCAVPDS
uniref:Uncharacterized protein n=1 Tax=Panagrolaimus superbus TaxID=310955 RepID=A0A914Y1Z9_9BILA